MPTTFNRHTSHSIYLLFSVYHMKETGFEVISEEDCTDLHYRYKEEKEKK